MKTELTTVQFYGETLYTTILNGLVYVAVKPICLALGLDWSAQLKRIKRDSDLSTCLAVFASVDHEEPVSMATVDGLNHGSMATVDGLKPVSMAKNLMALS